MAETSSSLSSPIKKKKQPVLKKKLPPKTTTTTTTTSNDNKKVPIPKGIPIKKKKKILGQEENNNDNNDNNNKNDDETTTTTNNNNTETVVGTKSPIKKKPIVKKKLPESSTTTTTTTTTSLSHNSPIKKKHPPVKKKKIPATESSSSSTKSNNQDNPTTTTTTTTQPQIKQQQQQPVLKKKKPSQEPSSLSSSSSKSPIKKKRPSVSKHSKISIPQVSSPEEDNNNDEVIPENIPIMDKNVTNDANTADTTTTTTTTSIIPNDKNDNSVENHHHHHSKDNRDGDDDDENHNNNDDDNNNYNNTTTLKASATAFTDDSNDDEDDDDEDIGHDHYDNKKDHDDDNLSTCAVKKKKHKKKDHHHHHKKKKDKSGSTNHDDNDDDDDDDDNNKNKKDLENEDNNDVDNVVDDASHKKQKQTKKQQQHHHHRGRSTTRHSNDNDNNDDNDDDKSHCSNNKSGRSRSRHRRKSKSSSSQHRRGRSRSKSTSSKKTKKNQRKSIPTTSTTANTSNTTTTTTSSISEAKQSFQQAQKREEATKRAITLELLDQIKVDKSILHLQEYIDSTISLLHDKSKYQSQILQYIYQMEATGHGISSKRQRQRRRLSVRDNDIVHTLVKSMENDSTITTISIDSDPRFVQLSTMLLLDFTKSLQDNLYLTSLCLKGLQLGNDILSSINDSLQPNTNFVLQSLDLRCNAFTNDGLLEFCQGTLRSNTTLQSIQLQTQQSPIFESGYQSIVLQSLQQNTTILVFEADIQMTSSSSNTTNEKGSALLLTTRIPKVQKLLERNKQNKEKAASSDDNDDKTKSKTKELFDQRLVQYFQEKANHAIELWEHEKTELEMQQIQDTEWNYLYELSVLFDTYNKQQQQQTLSSSLPPSKESTNHEEKQHPPERTKSNLLENIKFSADGNFLNEEFISTFLKEIPSADDHNETKEGLVVLFDYCNQFKLFQQFPTAHPNRETIVTKFVDALLNHPKSKDIISINMANSCTGDDFFEILALRCLTHKKKSQQPLLPKLQSLNAETNYITEPGIVAIAQCIAHPSTFRYLQILQLENQKSLSSSQAEMALAKAMCVNRSIVRLNLSIRNLREREQINKYLVRNIDTLRQARRHHAIHAGTLQARKRNEMEEFFDKIAADDESITEVNLVGNPKFLALTNEEKLKAASSFGTNSAVTTVIMTTLQLDDAFASALGKALETNDGIEKLVLDSNAISGDGMKSLFSGLGKNSQIVEMQARHQSKTTGSAEEEMLPELIESNMTITKLGIDLRSQLSKMKIDRKLAQNREHQRKLRVHQAKQYLAK